MTRNENKDVGIHFVHPNLRVLYYRTGLVRMNSINSEKLSCRSILISWAMIALGASIFYEYPTYGVAIAFIPFGVAAYIRGTHDRTLKEKLFSNPLWRLFALIYYTVLLILALLYASDVFSISIIWSAILIFLPFFVGMVVNDISCCSGRPRAD